MNRERPERRWATRFLWIASLSIVVFSFVGGPVSDWGLALAAVGYPIALIAIAGGRAMERARMRWSLFALAAMMGISAIAVLLMAASSPATTPRVLGLPLATLVMSIGLGLGPLALVLWAYTTTFDDSGPRF